MSKTICHQKTNKTKNPKFPFRFNSDKYLNDNIIKVSPELRDTISQIIARKIPPNRNVYDELQKNVEEIIAKRIYPEFLKSDVFIEYVEQHSRNNIKSITNQASTSRNSNSNININNTACNTDGNASYSTVGLSPLVMSPNLQTLHEDTELTISNEPISTKTTTDQPKLTRDFLLATQKSRLEVRPPG